MCNRDYPARDATVWGVRDERHFPAAHEDPRASSLPGPALDPCELTESASPSSVNDASVPMILGKASLALKERLASAEMGLL